MSNEMTPLTLLEAYDEMENVKGSYHKNFKSVYEHYGYKDDDPMSDYLEFIVRDLKGWFENTIESWINRVCADQQNCSINNIIKRPERYPKISPLITPEFVERYSANVKKIGRASCRERV